MDSSTIVRHFYSTASVRLGVWRLLATQKARKQMDDEKGAGLIHGDSPAHNSDANLEWIAKII